MFSSVSHHVTKCIAHALKDLGNRKQDIGNRVKERKGQTRSSIKGVIQGTRNERLRIGRLRKH
jgi:hypothetical protein